jgi:hypothetical protein
MNQRQKPRSYTYRIPMDDRRAIRRVRRLELLDTGYWINEIHSDQVPNGKAVRHWAVRFFKSTEHRDFETDEMVGGTIPGFHKYRYSLEWEPTPETELLEMRNANGGGTKIRGEKMVGTSDPRLPDYAPISTTVPWTPTEIKAMFNGDPVPDRVNYSHEPPELDANTARQKYRELIRQAADDGMKECRESLAEHIKNCDHRHVVETGHSYGDVAFCEDCGRGWDGLDFEHEQEAGNLTVVGSA